MILLPSLTKRRRRVHTPLMLQQEETECGAVSLGIVLAYFGRWVSMEELREACAVNRDGCDAADISRAARQYGLEAQGWRREPEQLRDMDLPLIIFWEFNHFLVLEGFRGPNYLVNDPANGHRVIDDEEFDQGFTGVPLSFRRGLDFQTGGAHPGILPRLWPWLREVTGPLSFAHWSGYQARELRARQRFAELGHVIASLPGTVPGQPATPRFWVSEAGG